MALSFVLWLPMLIVGIEGLLGVDPYLVLSAISDQGPSAFAWILANVAFGVAAMLGAIWASNRKMG